MHQNFLVQAIKNLKKVGSFRRKVAAHALAFKLKHKSKPEYKISK